MLYYVDGGAVTTLRCPRYIYIYPSIYISQLLECRKMVNLFQLLLQASSPIFQFYGKLLHSFINSQQRTFSTAVLSQMPLATEVNLIPLES